MEEPVSPCPGSIQGTGVDRPQRHWETQYALQITGKPDEVLEVNCASCPEPDLRDFIFGVHKAILFDEAKCKMVLAQKKLFQAGAAWVHLGCSVTNCHAYRVFVHGVMMIICCNTWTAELHALKFREDREWLETNSVVVEVTAPLWETDES